MRTVLRPTLILLTTLGVLTGLAYPLAVTGLARMIFPGKANGSLVVRDGRTVGSRLIGQSFSDLRHFWSRPSATTLVPYNAAASAGSNLAPSNPALIAAVSGRVAALRAADPGNAAPVPVDLVTASASGLDPHISVAAALYQVERVARARSLPVETVRDLVLRHVAGRTLGVLGEPRVNVLLLNLDLDQLPVATARSERQSTR